MFFFESFQITIIISAEQRYATRSGRIWGFLELRTLKTFRFESLALNSLSGIGQIPFPTNRCNAPIWFIPWKVGRYHICALTLFPTFRARKRRRASTSWSKKSIQEEDIETRSIECSGAVADQLMTVINQNQLSTITVFHAATQPALHHVWRLIANVPHEGVSG
jgi:hypothetical protein